MRISGRIAEERIHTRFELIGDMMLQLFGLVVHLIPGISQRFGQIELEQPVVAHDFERDALAGGS